MGEYTDDDIREALDWLTDRYGYRNCAAAVRRRLDDLASARSTLAEREKEIERLRAQLAVAETALNTIKAMCEK